MGNVKLQNWKRSISYEAARYEKVRSAEEIARIVRDRDTYPAPVRAKGSHHSTTECLVAEGGTVVDLSGMDEIVEIDEEAKTITMQAGVQHIDAAHALEERGLQFYVNCEIGNLTVGAGACSATKDASYYSERDESWEYGQVNSYVVGMKVVTPDGDIVEVTSEDGELMEVMRSSYGRLGIVFEVTYRVKEITPLAVDHVAFHVDEFADRFHELVAQNRSMMLFLFPFIDTVVVEFRYDGEPPYESDRWQWQFRNWMWKTGSPFVGRTLSSLVPFDGLRSSILDGYNRATRKVMNGLIRDTNSSPADQIIRYPEAAGYSSYTFSIWAVPAEEYPQAIRDYFQFCRDYYRKNGYRCDLANVGYYIVEDRQSLFSYTRDGPACTLDPVSTGGQGWDGFLTAYNEFCIQHGGKPLFNQSPGLTPLQVEASFGPEIATFKKYRREHDPDDRFYNPFFRELFSRVDG
jgi:FAD/FMN-containing dehydrogenase